MLYPAELPGPLSKNHRGPSKRSGLKASPRGKALSMNFRRAHRCRVGLGRPGLWLLCPCAALAALTLAGAALAECGFPAGRAQAVAVDERLDIELADGRIVRLAGLDAPTSGHGPPETAKAAHDLLASRLVGREADLVLLSRGTDRWGRWIGDLRIVESYGGPPRSAAAALIAAGYARVRPEFEARGCALERLAIEDGARRADLGVWGDPDYAVIPASDSAELSRRDGQFVVVEGTVSRVGFGRSRLYLDLGGHDGPTIVVARKLESAFARMGHPVGGLVGETIRARGALDDQFGPRIEIGDPAMIEILRGSSAPVDTKPR